MFSTVVDRQREQPLAHSINESFRKMTDEPMKYFAIELTYKEQKEGCVVLLINLEAEHFKKWTQVKYTTQLNQYFPHILQSHD